jgi:hypothetical protein
MKKHISVLMIGIGLLMVLLSTWPTPASAAPQAQLNTPFPTPTPGADGRILYVVQPGDTLWGIAALSGVTLDELRQLNNLGPDEAIIEGQVLLLGMAEILPAATETLAPGETPAAGIPTPTLEEGEAQQDTGVICVLLYDDLNGDGIRQETEVAVEGGEASVTERTGLYSDKKSTKTGTDPVCFDNDLPPGNYIVTMAIPDGYNATTALSVDFELMAGDTTYLNFGAQLTARAEQEIPLLAESGRATLFGIIGVALLLGGIGAFIYSVRLARRR